jgi:hypothetical protein
MAPPATVGKRPSPPSPISGRSHRRQTLEPPSDGAGAAGAGAGAVSGTKESLESMHMQFTRVHITCESERVREVGLPSVEAWWAPSSFHCAVLHCSSSVIHLRLCASGGLASPEQACRSHHTPNSGRCVVPSRCNGRTRTHLSHAHQSLCLAPPAVVDAAAMAPRDSRSCTHSHVCMATLRDGFAPPWTTPLHAQC